MKYFSKMKVYGKHACLCVISSNTLKAECDLQIKEKCLD